MASPAHYSSERRSKSAGRSRRSSPSSGKGGTNRPKKHDRRRHRAQNMYKTHSGANNSLLDAYEGDGDGAGGGAGDGRGDNLGRRSRPSGASSSTANGTASRGNATATGQKGCADLVMPEAIRSQIEIERNSASVRKVRDGCVTPTLNVVRDTAAFIKMARNGEIGGVDGLDSVAAKRRKSGGSPESSPGRNSSSSGGSRRSRSAGRSVGKNREATSRNYDQHPAVVDRGTDDHFLGGRSRSEALDDIIGNAAAAAAAAPAAAAAAAASPSSSTDSESDLFGDDDDGSIQNQRRRAPRRQQDEVDADVNASIQRRMKVERDWMPNASTSPKASRGKGIGDGRGGTDVSRSPRGVDSPDKRIRRDAERAAADKPGRDRAINDMRKRAERQAAAIGFDNGALYSGGSRDDGQVSLGTNLRSSPTASDVDVADAAGGGSNIGFGEAAVAPEILAAAGAHADETSVMRDLRLSLFQSDEPSIAGTTSSKSTTDHGDENMVPVSRLKRAMGELVIQDDFIDKLQLELEDVQTSRDKLQSEVELLREAASARGADRSRKEAAAVQIDLEKVRENLEQANADKEVRQSEIESLMLEMNKLKADIAEKDEELQRNEHHRKHQDQLRERSMSRQKRQDEEIARLETKLANLTKRNPSLSALTRKDSTTLGLPSTRDPEGIDANSSDDESAMTGMTYPQRKQSARAVAARSTRSTRSTRSVSPSHDAVEELQYRADVVDLKLQLSEAEANISDAEFRLREEQTQAKKDIDELTADLDRVRAALEKEMISRAVLENDLKQSNEAALVTRNILEDEGNWRVNDLEHHAAAADDTGGASADTLEQVQGNLMEERNARKMVEEELMRARAMEQDLRTAKDILANRLEEEIWRQRHLHASADASRSVRSEPVDVDEFDDEMRRKDGEIASMRAELERMSNALPELNTAILIAREEADQELVQAQEALEMAQSEAENEKLTRLDAEGIISELREELDKSEDTKKKLQRATVEAEKRSDMLQSEVDELKEMLEEAEKGLRISQEQIDTIQDENEALKEMLDDAAHTANLVEREINASVEEDVSLRAELDSLQELLAETERDASEMKLALEQELAAKKEEVARSVAHRGMQQTEREMSLEEELAAMKKQMNAAEKILLDAKKQHENEWSARQKLEETLRKENDNLTKQLSAAQEQSESECKLSVKNVSLQTQITSLNGRLADLSTQLTSLETQLTEKTETEATLREAIDILRRRCALLQQKCPGVLKCEPDLSIDPDDILDAEVDRLNELLSVVSADDSDDDDRDLATRSIDRTEIDDVTRELEGRLHKAERARLAAEDRVVATQETMHKGRADAVEALTKAEQKSMFEKKQLEERLEQHVEMSESLRNDLAHIKEQLRMAGIKVGDAPQNKAKVSFSSSEAAEAKDILVRSKAVSTGYQEEISELKLLLDRVVQENERMVGDGDNTNSKELNELSNRKLQEARTDLKRCVRKIEQCNQLKESIKSNCEAIMHIHEQQQDLKEGKWIGPTDELVGSVEKLY